MVDRLRVTPRYALFRILAVSGLAAGGYAGVIAVETASAWNGQFNVSANCVYAEATLNPSPADHVAHRTINGQDTGDLQVPWQPGQTSETFVAHVDWNNSHNVFDATKSVAKPDNCVPTATNTAEASATATQKDTATSTSTKAASATSSETLEASATASATDTEAPATSTGTVLASATASRTATARATATIDRTENASPTVKTTLNTATVEATTAAPSASDTPQPANTPVINIVSGGEPWILSLDNLSTRRALVALGLLGAGTAYALIRRKQAGNAR